MVDIMNDLNKLNENLRYYPNWRKSIKEILGKEQLELKDFENWSLSEILEKL